MLSSTPRLIRVYKTILYGQEVEVKVFSPGKSRRVEEEVELEEVITEMDVPDEAAEPETKDLTQILEEIERYVEEQESQEEERPQD